MSTSARMWSTALSTCARARTGHAFAHARTQPPMHAGIHAHVHTCTQAHACTHAHTKHACTPRHAPESAQGAGVREQARVCTVHTVRRRCCSTAAWSLTPFPPPKKHGTRAQPVRVQHITLPRMCTQAPCAAHALPHPGTACRRAIPPTDTLPCPGACLSIPRPACAPSCPGAAALTQGWSC